MKKLVFSKIFIGICLCLIALNTTATAASGKKYALFVGINAYAERPLQGCVNDAKNMQIALAKRYGFAANNTTLLLDQQATRAGILNALQNYQTKVGAGDVFVFTYSGHGTLFADSKSEEQDETEELSIPGTQYAPGKYDSAICPIDSKSDTSGKPWNNIILDDELFKVFSGFTAKGAQVVFVSDSCHSGTLARALGGQVLNLPKADQANVRFYPFNEIKSFDSIKNPSRTEVVRRRSTDANDLLIVLTGSKDTEYSHDFKASNNVWGGLFTMILLDAIEYANEQNKKPNYVMVQQLVSPAVNEVSQKVYKQTQMPQIDARFFKGDLSVGLFEFAGKPNAAVQTQNPPPVVAANSNAVANNAATTTNAPAQNLLRVVVKVTDKNDNPIESAAVGIFNPSAKSLLTGAGNVAKIPSRDIRATGRTDKKGLYDSKSQALYIPLGTYLIKVIRDGYQPYIGDVTVAENAEGFAVLIVKLSR